MGASYRLVIAIVKLSGFPLFTTAGADVGIGVVKGVWLEDFSTFTLFAIGVSLGMLLGVALEKLMLEIVPGVMLAKVNLFFSGVVWTGASVADGGLGGVIEVSMIRLGVLVGNELSEDD